MADENGWELVLEIEPAPSVVPVSVTISTSAPGSGVFRKVAEEVLDSDARSDEATMATDPAPPSGSEDEDVRLPAPARLPPDLTGDKTRVA